MGGWRRRALGWFLEFRLIPVLLWSYTAVALGTALAYADGGGIDLGWLAVSMALAGLVQGWVTHAVNEVYDWRSGADRGGSPPGPLGGGQGLGPGGRGPGVARPCPPRSASRRPR